LWRRIAVAGEAEDRQNVKAALEAAQVEIGKALGRVDNANGSELAELKAGARSMVAFVDFNTSCGAAALDTADMLGKLRG